METARRDSNTWMKYFRFIYMGKMPRKPVAVMVLVVAQ